MIATLLILSATLSDAKPRPSEPPVPGVTAESFARAAPEHRIAMLDARKWVDPRDLSVLQARDLLGRVDRLYAEDVATIARLIELFWREIRSKKREASATEILSGALEWQEPGDFQDGKGDFAEYVVLYATLREESFSHEKAIAELRKVGRRRPNDGK